MSAEFPFPVIDRNGNPVTNYTGTATVIFEAKGERHEVNATFVNGKVVKHGRGHSVRNQNPQ